MQEKEIEDVFKKFLSRLNDEDKTYADLIQSMQHFNKRVKESVVETKLLTGIIRKQNASYTDTEEVMSNYRKAVAEIGDALTEEEKRVRDIEANKAKDEGLRAVREKNILAAKQNFAVGIMNVTQQVVTGVATATADLVKSMQNNTGGVGFATSGLKLGVDAITGAITTTTSSISHLGTALSIMSKSIFGKVGGLVIEAAGSAVGGSAKVASEAVKAGIDILSREIEKAMETYSAAASAGAIFANGATEFRKASHDAGLSVVTMSNIIKNNSESLYVSGLNLGAATKKISDVFKVGSENFKRSLFNLGYSLEEQGALIAETMKYLSIAGADLRSLDNNTIRIETEKYAMNLKTISAITGEDAKKRMEESRRAMANSAIQEKLAKMDPETRKKFQVDLAKVDENLKQQVLQLIVFGNVLEHNLASAIGIAPEVGFALEKVANSLGKGGTEADEAVTAFKSTFKAAVDAGKFSQLGIAALSPIASQAAEVDKTLQSLTLGAQQGSKIVGGVSEIVSSLTSMKNTSDELTGNLSTLNIQAASLTSTLEKRLNEHLPKFATFLEQVNNAMIKFVDDAGKWLSGKNTSVDKAEQPGLSRETITNIGTGMGAILGVLRGAAAGAAAGAPAGPMGMAVGAGAGAFAGYGVGELTGIAMEKAVYPAISYIKSLFSSREGKAFGGISSGPNTGYLEKLHGTEAVIPLPDGKTVPVNLTFPKDINYIAPEPKERMLFTRDLNLDKLTTQVSLVKNSIDELTNNMPTLTIPPEFKTSMELSNASLKEVIREQTVLIRDYNEKLERLLSVATDNKNINQQILNATY